jgi:hypothetical protein
MRTTLARRAAYSGSDAGRILAAQREWSKNASEE